MMIKILRQDYDFVKSLVPPKRLCLGYGIVMQEPTFLVSDKTSLSRQILRQAEIVTFAPKY